MTFIIINDIIILYSSSEAQNIIINSFTTTKEVYLNPYLLIKQLHLTKV